MVFPFKPLQGLNSRLPLWWWVPPSAPPLVPLRLLQASLGKGQAQGMVGIRDLQRQRWAADFTPRRKLVDLVRPGSMPNWTCGLIEVNLVEIKSSDLLLFLIIYVKRSKAVKTIIWCMSFLWWMSLKPCHFLPGLANTCQHCSMVGPFQQNRGTSDISRLNLNKTYIFLGGHRVASW